MAAEDWGTAMAPHWALSSALQPLPPPPLTLHPHTSTSDGERVGDWEGDGEGTGSRWRQQKLNGDFQAKDDKYQARLPAAAASLWHHRGTVQRVPIYS